MARILVIDDQERTIRLCRRWLPTHSWEGPASSWAEARPALETTSPDLVLLDVRFDLPAEQLLGAREGMAEAELQSLRDSQGWSILAALRHLQPDLPVIVMSGSFSELEPEALRQGASEATWIHDHETLDAEALRALVGTVLEAAQAPEVEGPLFWGRSPALRRMRQRLSVLSRGRLPVILGGPTGTGKSMLARHFVHPRSGRSGPFVAVDLTTLPRDLVPAHLFGSVKGAWTGAITDRKGAFEEAHGGTLFIDEIGHLGEDVQRMLLTVLQEGQVTRVGDLRSRPVDVKLVVATHEDLPALVSAGRFRADLHQRLNPGSTVRLPPLAERRRELEPLLRFTVARIAELPATVDLVEELLRRRRIRQPPLLELALGQPLEEGPPLQLLIPERGLALIRQHAWPGNLREFAMTMENAVVLALAEAIEAGAPPVRSERVVVQLRPMVLHQLLAASS